MYYVSARLSSNRNYPECVCCKYICHPGAVNNCCELDRISIKLDLSVTRISRGAPLVEKKLNAAAAAPHLYKVELFECRFGFAVMHFLI